MYHVIVYARLEPILKRNVAEAIQRGERARPYTVRVTSNLGRTPYSADFPYYKLQAAAGTTMHTVTGSNINNRPPPTLPNDDSVVLPVLWSPSEAMLRVDWTEEAMEECVDPAWREDDGDHVKHASASGGVAAGNAGLTLQRCLQAFSQPEVLSADNEWYCPKCKVGDMSACRVVCCPTSQVTVTLTQLLRSSSHVQNHLRAIKRLSIWNVPQYLTIQLKRFHFEQRMGYGTSYGNFGNSYNNKNPSFAREKIDTFVDFPLDGLDLTPFVRGGHCAGGRGGEGYDAGETSLIFDCIAVSNHMGGMGGGHYTAFARREGRWFEFNDATVSEVGDTSRIVGPNAYVLFYKRRD